MQSSPGRLLRQKGRVSSHATRAARKTNSMVRKPSTREKSPGPISPEDVPIDALPVVELTRDDVFRALALAQQRNESYAAIDGGVVFGDNNALTSHQIGVLGELALSQLYGIPIDEATYHRGDDGQDHTLFTAGVDVKTTATDKVRRPELLVRADKELAAPLYVRAHLTEFTRSGAHVRFIGCAPREVVEARSPQRHPGTTENYVVPPSEMSFMPMLDALND